MPHALVAGCPGPPGAGVGQEPSEGCGRGGTLRRPGWGREAGRGAGGRLGGGGGQGQSGPHLQLGLQARSFAQERGHHVVCDRELVWDPRAAAEQARVDAIQVLVPKEAVLCPVLGHVLWGDRAGASRCDPIPSGTEKESAHPKRLGEENPAPQPRVVRPERLGAAFISGAARGRARPCDFLPRVRAAGPRFPSRSCLVRAAPARHRPAPPCLGQFPVPHPIPVTTDLLVGKIFLMSFSLFHDRVQSTRPRSLNASALRQGIRGGAVRGAGPCPLGRR